MTEQTIVTLLLISGAAHLIMSAVTLVIPTMLNWKPHLEAMPTLMRQVFWTYSSYIKFVNTSFGVVSILGAEELAGTSFLAKSVNLFIVIYWLARLGVEFFYYDRSSLKGIARVADLTLNVLLVFFILVHASAFAHNMHVI